MTRARSTATRTGLQRIGERFAFEQLHDQEGDAVLIADVVERADGGVIQPRDRARLTCETIEMYLFEPPGCGQNLDRHQPVEPRIPGSKDLTHPSGADAGHDFVGADSRAHAQGHVAAIVMPGWIQCAWLLLHWLQNR